jgi:hypothetical protein
MRWHVVEKLSQRQGFNAAGCLVVTDTIIARCGDQVYHFSEVPLDPDDDGFVRVSRDESEVFRPESVASFEGVPLTDDHPQVEVTPQNYRQLAVGHIQHVRRGSGADSDCLVADLVIFDPDVIDKVRNKRKLALSAGYDAYYEHVSRGRGAQRRIIANHVALVDEGRCGARCSICDSGALIYSYIADDPPPFIESEHPRDPEGKFALHTMEGAQAFIDKLSEQYPIAKSEQYPIQGPHRPEVRPDDIPGVEEHSIAQHRGGHIYLTPQYWNKEFLDKHNKEMEGSMNDSTTEGILTHEFGHLLSHKLEAKIDPITLWNIVYKHLGHTGGNLGISNDQTSPYGAENIFEFIAEAFTHYHNGKLPSTVGPDHPFREKMERTQQGVWKELLDTAAGPALPKTPEAARYMATHYDLGHYSTERLQAARDLLEGSSTRGDGKNRTTLDRELKARAKAAKVSDDDWTRDIDFVESEHPRDPVGKFATAPGGSAGVTAEQHLGHAAQAHRKALAHERAAEGASPVVQAAAHRAVAHAETHLDAARETHAQITSGGESRKESNPDAAAVFAGAKLPPGSRTKATRQRYAEVKALAERIEGMKNLPSGGLSALNNWIPMSDLKSAVNTLWETRGREGGKPFDAADQKLMDTLTDEIKRRFKADHEEREKRADAYAYMTDDEIYEATKVNFSGNSRMKPGMKRQLGLLPPSHIRRLQANGVAIEAVQEIERMGPEHPYAAGIQPAGVYIPWENRVKVADHVTMPDGTTRQIYSRAAVLRHEIGHAIDDFTGLGNDPEIAKAVDAGIAKMTPEERATAAYWVGDTARDEHWRERTRRSEMFAELYAYAFNDGTLSDEESGSLGGMGMERRYELFGPARAIIRQKVADAFGDRMLDRRWRAAA